MDFKITKMSLIERLRAHCASNGLEFATSTRDRGHGLQLLVTIDGAEMTPGEARDRYLTCEATLSPLDDRAMAMANRIEEAGNADAACALRSSLAQIREAWRGADIQENLAVDLLSISESAQSAADIVAIHFGIL